MIGYYTKKFGLGVLFSDLNNDNDSDALFRLCFEERFGVRNKAEISIGSDWADSLSRLSAVLDNA